jgi:biotin carboxyl carrier protein
VRLLISLEGQRYEVDVEVLPDDSADESDGECGISIPESVLLPPLLPDTRDTDRICRSPIAGAIVSVDVAVGMRIRQDDPVVTIDAMKMETVVGAPVDGVVEEVVVRPGDAVKTGQVLCRLG